MKYKDHVRCRLGGVGRRSRTDHEMGGTLAGRVHQKVPIRRPRSSWVQLSPLSFGVANRGEIPVAVGAAAGNHVVRLGRG